MVLDTAPATPPATKAATTGSAILPLSLPTNLLLFPEDASLIEAELGGNWVNLAKVLSLEVFDSS